MSNINTVVCRETIINYEKVEAARKNLPSDPEINNLAETFKILGDPTRLRIVLGLTQQELCVCDLATLVNLSVSAVSHQLRLLRNLKLAKFRKDGKMVYYSLDDAHIENIIRLAQVHVRE